MNFFEHQERARRQSRLLLLSFAVAVALVVIVLNWILGLLALSLDWVQGGWQGWFARPYWTYLSLALLAIIGFGSWRRLHQTWRHGDALAIWAGARPLPPAPDDAGERALRNVVEEMAIAAGTPAPSIWVLDREPGINAFVAGTRVDNAALVATRGTLAALDREQLQGVVAHEFSHVFHGDMRLNLQLLGVLGGLENLTQLGNRLLRLAARSGDLRALPPLLVGGLLLSAVGSLGWFCARLIRAALSRQREFLADASAVRYTRNARGIAGALAAIRDSRHGGLLLGPRAEALSHFCFALPVGGLNARWLASHPPLADRIARIDPHFDLKRRSRRDRRPRRPPAGAEQGYAAVSRDLPPLSGAEVAALVGAPTAGHLDYAGRLLDRLPDAVNLAVHHAGDALALVCALLLSEDGAVRDRQRASLDEVDEPGLAARAGALRGTMDAELPRLRLPVLELALATLRQGDPERLRRLRGVVAELVAADGRLGLFELLLATLVEEETAPRPTPRATIFRFGAVGEELSRLIWGLLSLDGGAANRHQIYTRTMRGFLREPPAPPRGAALDAATLARVAERLARLAPMLKAPVLQACVDCVLVDGHLSAAETELLRVLAALLHCPLPPLLGEAAPGRAGAPRSQPDLQTSR